MTLSIFVDAVSYLDGFLPVFTTDKSTGTLTPL